MSPNSMSRRVLIATCALIYFFLMLPLLVVFPISLSSAPYMQFPPPGFSWQWYERYLDDPQWIDSTWRSLYIGGATALLALALGVPLAFALVRGRFFGRTILDRVALAPIIVPHIIFAVAVYGLFAKLKLIGTWYGLVIGHTVLALPFVVLVIAAGLRDFDRSLEQAAQGLGASRWQTLRKVTLPLLRPSLVSAGLLAFISSFDEVVVALFLAGANMTLPKKMFDNIMMEIDPTIAAVSVMQILLVSVVLVLIGRFGRGLKDSAR
jgi:putative spermidine/putrescine transport system permease protein